MKPSISRQWTRTSARQRLRCDSGSDSRKMSSPWSEHSTGTRSRRFSSWTMPDSSALVRLTISRLDLVGQPVHQLVHFLALMAVLAFEHGDGQLAQIRAPAS